MNLRFPIQFFLAWLFLSPSLVLCAPDLPRFNFCDLAIYEVDPQWKDAVRKRLEGLEALWLAREKAEGGHVLLNSKELADHALLVEAYRSIRHMGEEIMDGLRAVEEMEKAGDADAPSFRQMVEDRNHELRALIGTAAPRLREKLLEMVDPPPSKKFILEINAAGTGLDGEVFVGKLSEMYQAAAKKAGSAKVKMEVLDFTPGAITGGFKQVVIAVEGPEAYQFVRGEAGYHMWKSQSLTKAQTFSTPVQVLVTPELPAKEFSLPESDYEVTTTTSGGPGGQKVNKTESAVRIRHKTLPIEVFMRDERSQHQNRAIGMRIFTARVKQYLEKEAAKASGDARKKQVDQDATIRTYRNVNPKVVVDERTGQKVNYDDVMSGESLGDFRPEYDSHRLEQILLNSPAPTIPD